MSLAEDTSRGGRRKRRGKEATVNPADVIDLAQDAIWVLIKVAGPVMIVGLVVGLIISLVQAVTQIQEMTLAFVPKILSIFVALVLFLPFMGSTLNTFMHEIAQRIAALPLR